MKQRYVIIGILFLIFFLPPLHGVAKEGNPKSAYRQAKKYYKKSDFVKAIPFLKAAYNLDPENAKYAYMLGRSVFEGSDPASAMSYLVAAYNMDQKVAEDINYYLARTMHMNLLFDEAITYYQADLQRHDPDTWLYQDTKMRIIQCQNGPKTVKRLVNYKIENLGEYVNTSYPEYSSTFSEDYQYMIYTTRRPRTVKQIARRKYHVEDINEEVYEARFVSNAWRKSKLFIKPIPRWTHDASIKLSQNGTTLIYYVDNRNRGDVYVSELKNGEWTKRKSIGANINTKEYNEPSVFIADEGQTLYWVSDKPNGKGMKDMYFSKKDANGEWGPGTNMGDIINTPYDEDAPYLSADGKKLYFSSRGHNSMGGYDLFVSNKLPDGTWGKPENLGIPLNSVGDDIYIVWKDGADGFYFSSDRPGGFGEKDIYYASPSTDAMPNTTIVAGTVLDRETGKPVVAEVKLIDVATNEVLGTTNTTLLDGKYRFVLPACGAEYRIDVKVDQENAGPVATTIGKYNVVSGRITDAVTEVPLDGVVELIDAETEQVIDQMPTNPRTGNYMFPVESGRKYLIRAKSNEYLTYYEEFNVAPSGQLISHYEDIGLQKLTEANKLVITWQFFDVDKHLIKSDYIKDLENVVTVMNKVPNMKLNIIGHTDSDATEEHNQELSENRARAVAKYLTDRGIDPIRLNISGMGESMPLYPNTTIETKRWNRRVELYIIE
jgi:OmpA family/WD40-like Beta Propeller Repeat